MSASGLLRGLLPKARQRREGLYRWAVFDLKDSGPFINAPQMRTFSARTIVLGLAPQGKT
jgi:hypothetical protein